MYLMEDSGDWRKKKILFQIIKMYRGQLKLTLKGGNLGRAFLHALMFHKYSHGITSCSRLTHLVRSSMGLWGVGSLSPGSWHWHWHVHRGRLRPFVCGDLWRHVHVAS